MLNAQFRFYTGGALVPAALVMLSLSLPKPHAAYGDVPVTAPGGANAYMQENLVSDLDGTALRTDPNLINPWGIVPFPNGPFWISDNAQEWSPWDGALPAIDGSVCSGENEDRSDYWKGQHAERASPMVHHAPV
jgi:hypothetical protein